MQKYIYFHTHPFRIVSSSTGYFFYFFIKKEEQEERERNLLLLHLCCIWKGKKYCTFWQFMLRVLEHFIWMCCCLCCCMFSSMTVSSPIMHIWGHLLHILTICIYATIHISKKGWNFPMNFHYWCCVYASSSSSSSSCVRKYFIILFTIIFICSFDWNSFFVNANKSIIYHQTGFLKIYVVQKWWEN